MVSAMLRRRLGSGVALLALLGGCTETVVRCQVGFVDGGVVDGQAVCVAADAAVAPDAAMDGGADAAADASPMDACDAAAADPPGDGQDTNCDGVDGVAGDTIFVATGGMDTNTGLTPQQPVLSVTRALAIAGAGARRSILVSVGVFDALPVMLGDAGDAPTLATHLLVDGVTVSGRYAAGGWVARSTDAAARTVLRGQVVGALIRDLRTGVTLRDVDITSEQAGSLAGVSCYGLYVAG
ncbi:MAG: hypothetical protein JWM10_5240, partial [Myxococcaceae bacterium]|nr:hypothetical protein [Myxococcaceae bacterium]